MGDRITIGVWSDGRAESMDVEDAIDAIKHWSNIAPEQIFTICTANGIKLVGDYTHELDAARAKMIDREDLE